MLASLLPTADRARIGPIEANAFALHSTVAAAPDKGPLPNLGYFLTVSLSLPFWDWGSRSSKVRQAALKRDQASVDLSVTQRTLIRNFQGFYKEAGEWFAEKQVKLIGTDTQALDHPLGTAIGPHGPGAPHGLLPDVNEEYRRETGRRVIDDFPLWEPCHRAILSAGICGIENLGDRPTGVHRNERVPESIVWRMQGDGQSDWQPLTGQVANACTHHGVGHHSLGGLGCWRP